ncbi:MAG: CbiX/SirB N-terminal domain-containing protein [Acidiferrobacterales bacterium]|nr:CbiX/SirB N-terminal domain-containing protein [Acidiferrobacterales bacterium]
MKTLVLLAHGSRHRATADEVAVLATSIAATTKCDVRHAFLEINRPTLIDTIAQAVEDGAKRITVLPLFVNTGNHIVRDLPQLIAEARERFPSVRLELLRHIGAHPGYTGLVETIAREAAGL